jgi:hypothetical protein
VFTYHLPLRVLLLPGGCVKSKNQVFFDILYKKGNALYLFILVFLLLSFGKCPLLGILNTPIVDLLQ